VLVHRPQKGQEKERTAIRVELNLEVGYLEREGSPDYQQRCCKIRIHKRKGGERGPKY